MGKLKELALFIVVTTVIAVFLYYSTLTGFSYGHWNNVDPDRDKLGFLCSFYSVYSFEEDDAATEQRLRGIRGCPVRGNVRFPVDYVYFRWNPRV